MTTANKKSSKSASAKAAGKPPSKRASSLPKEGRDPKGGVKGVPNTPEKKQRKGSFLTRHFTTPPGPVVKDGQPTRQALQAAAWGEPIPKTEADEKKLASKGRQLLQEAKAAKAEK